MTKKLLTGRRAAVLLTGLLVALATSGSLEAYYEVLDPDFAFVPSDAAAFLTVRAADLAGKLGVKEGAGKNSWAAAWQQGVGLPLNNVDRCTLVSPNSDPNSGGTCVILRTVKPYKIDDILKACVPDAKQVKYHRKVCYVSATNNTAVHCVNDRLLLVGDPEAVKKCLSQAAESRPNKNLTDALILAGKHDVVLWCRAVSTPNTDGPLAPLGAVPPVTSYKPRLSALSGLGRTTTVSQKPKRDAANEDKPPPAENPPVLMGFCPVPLPHGVEAGLIFMDVDEQLTIEVRLNCADELSAQKTEKVMRAVVGMMRAELLGAVSELDLAKAIPTLAEGAVLPPLPTKLMRQAEKALQHALIHTEGKTVPMTISIPINAKTLRSELAACCTGDNSLPMPMQCMTWFPGSCLMGSPRYAVPPVPYEAPVSPPVGPYGSATSAPPPPAATQAAPVTATWSPAPSAPQPTVALPPPAPPVARVVPAAPMTTNTAAFPVKLTVANVRKEMVLLFSIDDNGKVVFAQKVAPGEAIDLQTTSGQRWLAMWTNNPAGETFTPTKVIETWLLRSEASAVSSSPDPTSVSR